MDPLLNEGLSALGALSLLLAAVLGLNLLDRLTRGYRGKRR